MLLLRLYQSMNGVSNFVVQNEINRFMFYAKKNNFLKQTPKDSVSISEIIEIPRIWNVVILKISYYFEKLLTRKRYLLRGHPRRGSQSGA